MRIRIQNNLHLIRCLQFLGHHSDVAELQLCLVARNIQSEVTIDVGNCTRSSTYNLDRCTDNR